MRNKIMGNLNFISVGLFVLAVVGCTKGTPSTTEEAVNVYSSEEDAAYEGSFNRPTPIPLESLPKGVEVTVLYDRYGKDYWACNIRTASNTEGWVLCTSLRYKRGK